jgi:hypothetical protein
MKESVYNITLDQEPPDGDLVVRLKDVKEPPAEWSLLIGDCVQNLRSSLDHLAFQLARLTTRVPPPGTEFPIFRSGPKFRKRDKKGLPARGSGWYKVRAFPRSAQTICERLQPYHGRAWPETRLLWQLHELSIVDKHRLLHAANYYAVGSNLEVSLTGDTRLAGYKLTPGRLKERAVLARLRMGWSDVGAQVHVNPHLAIRIVFDQGGEARSVRGRDLVGTLGDIGRFVDFEVFTRLAPFFGYPVGGLSPLPPSRG